MFINNTSMQERKRRSRSIVARQWAGGKYRQKNPSITHPGLVTDPGWDVSDPGESLAKLCRKSFRPCVVWRASTVCTWRGAHCRVTPRATLSPGGEVAGSVPELDLAPNCARPQVARLGKKFLSESESRSCWQYRSSSRFPYFPPFLANWCRTVRQYSVMPRYHGNFVT